MNKMYEIKYEQMSIMNDCYALVYIWPTYYLVT